MNRFKKSIKQVILDWLMVIGVAVGGAMGIVGLIILYLGLAFAPTWLVLSGVTSGVKALTGNCGHEYPVEVVLGGNWFCPKDKK